MPDVAGAAPPATGPVDGSDAALEALLRAVPLTRMVDTGLEVGSALRVVAMTRAGRDWPASCLVEHDTILRRVDELGSDLDLPLRRQAIAALVVAQLALNDDTDRKRELYASLCGSTRELAARPAAHCEVVAVPWRGSAMSGVLVHPPAGRSEGTVVIFGGLNGWGAAYWAAADLLGSRRLSALLVELPGQGDTRLSGGLVADAQVAESISAVVDWTEAHPRLAGPVGVWGNSFGGLFAALAAAADDRLRACVVNGAPAKPSLPEFRTARELMFPFFGSTDPGAVAEVLDRLSFAGHGRRITGDVLVLHGGADPLVCLEDQLPFLEAGAAVARWVEWPDGEHTIYNHAGERNAVAVDFLSQALRASSDHISIATGKARP